MRILMVLAVMLAIVGAATATSGPLLAVSNAGNVPQNDVVALSGTSSTVFNTSEFAKEPLNARGLREDLPVKMQKYDHDDFSWSIRDFLDYDIEL